MLSNQTFYVEEEKLKCMICGFASNQLVSHIKAKHNMSSKEYKNAFLGAKLGKFTNAQIEKMNQTRPVEGSGRQLYLSKREKNNQEIESLGWRPLVCEMCKFETNLSLISHITRKHKIKMSDYHVLYQDCVVQRNSPQQKRKHSNAMKERHSDPEKLQKFLEWRSFPSEIKHWIKKGLTEDKAIAEVAKFQSSQSLKGNNQKTRELRSKKSKGDNNPMSLQSIALRENVSIEEAKMLTPAYGRSGELHPFYGKHHTEDARTKIAANMPKTKYNRSKAEDEIAEVLKSNNIDLVQNVGVSTYNVDIFIKEKKLIIEYFGDMWHCNPSKYKENEFNNRIKMIASERWNLDRIKIEKLQSLGYNVLVVWEDDWNKKRSEQITRILNVTNFV